MTIEDIRRKHEGQKKIYTGTTLNAKANSILTTDDVDRLLAALDEARRKVERALKIASMRSKYPATMTNYYLEHIEEIEQILRGEP